MSDEMENKTLENEYPEETKDVAEANNASSAADDTLPEVFDTSSDEAENTAPVAESGEIEVDSDAENIEEETLEKKKEVPFQTFYVGYDQFILNNKPFLIAAGAVHYFRIPKDYWRDRLLKLKACGFNTVITSIPWNIHEKNEGAYDFSGNNDVEGFLDLARDLGLYAIICPGPYIGADWEFGGFPWWLLKYDNIELRCMDETYLKLVDRYFDELIPRLANHQICRGGNVIMVQAENEYGSYGDDTEYVKYIVKGLIDRGIEMPIFTSDGIEDHQLINGSVEGVLRTAKFGANPSVNLPYLREFQETGPLMASEFWNGWFDTWGYKHYQRVPKDAAKSLQKTMADDASCAVYMFAGGTNFGLMNGAVSDEEYMPVVSSYDCDALLTEAGDVTPKYELYKKTLANHIKMDEEVQLDPQVPKAKYGKVPFTHWALLSENINNLSSPVKMKTPLPMEKIGQGYGYILYKTHLKGPRDYMPLILEGVHDRAYVFVNDDLYAVQSRNDEEYIVKLKVPEEGLDLSILVENMGRVSFGQELKDYKGLKSVRLGQTYVFNWEAYPIELNDLSRLEFKAESDMIFYDHPTFFKAQFIIEETPADTFVKLPDFTKGVIFINGRPLSRYWKEGPQRSAYLPAPFLIQGVNEIVVFETDGVEKKKDNPYVYFDNKPSLA